MARSTDPIRILKRHAPGRHIILDEEGQRGVVYRNEIPAQREAIEGELGYLAHQVSRVVGKRDDEVQEYLDGELQAGRSLPLSSRM